jgi:Bacteriophage HK97-gp10, putative tail-component
MATTNLVWRQDRVISRARATMLRRGQVAASAAERQVRDRLSTPSPPPSTAGQPPHRRTGVLQRSIVGNVRLLTNIVRVTVTALAPYARFLQRGTRRMASRPFLGFPVDARLIVDILSGRRRG